MIRKGVILIVFFFLSLSLTAQIGDKELRNTFNSIVFLRDSLPQTYKYYDNKLYEIHLKDLSSNKIFPLKSAISGSGFIVNKYFDNYLVTAYHVARELTETSTITFRGIKGNKKEFELKELASKNSKWIFHSNADIAVLPLNLFDRDSIFLKNLEIGAFDYWDVNSIPSAPDRFEDLIVAGFPLGLGESNNTISPITKKAKTSSDLIVLDLFRNGKQNSIYLLDDPSVSGFSGGPVLRIYDPLMSIDKKSYLPGPLKIFGIVHGSINDPVDKTGKFAVIVPSFQIIEAIDLAPSYDGVYTYKYPNGSEWSKLRYRNGIPWTVFTNFNSKGEEQEKGTLKNGTGTLFIYDENGKLLYVETYKTGKRTSLAPSMTTEELKKFGKTTSKKSN